MMSTAEVIELRDHQARVAHMAKECKMALFKQKIDVECTVVVLEYLENKAQNMARQLPPVPEVVKPEVKP